MIEQMTEMDFLFTHMVVFGFFPLVLTQCVQKWGAARRGELKVWRIKALITIKFIGAAALDY